MRQARCERSTRVECRHVAQPRRLSRAEARRRAKKLIGNCRNVGLAGCTVAITPPASLLEYSKNGVPTMTATSTEASGYAIAYGLLSGITTFSATRPTLGAMREKQIRAVENEGPEQLPLLRPIMSTTVRP